jgi:hypothetical protein
MCHPHRRQSLYQLSYNGSSRAHFNKDYQVVIKKLENKIIYYKKQLIVNTCYFGQ